MKWKQSVQKGWRPMLVIILLFGVWEAISRMTSLPKWLLPAPSDIFIEGISNYTLYARDVVSTVKLTMIGFIIGTGFGLIVAIILHLLPSVKEAVYPLLILSQNIPIIVLAPLLIIWFGFGLFPKIIVITLVCFFPISIAALDGFRQTPAELRHYLDMAGARPSQIFWKLELPYALPVIFSGLKISATYSVMGAIISEWLGAESGIGVYMTLASSSFQTVRVFVAIFIIMILSLMFFCMIIGLEKLIVKWQPKGEK
jgi:ABC-type nitrate/sulfonate/bicarbonate transport system permease component